MKNSYSDKLHLSKSNTKKLSVINGIIDEYAAQGYKMTLRQLYYQLVSRDVIPNNVKEYGKLSRLLVEGRMAGIVDWDAIEDRIRVPYLPYYAEDPADALDDIIGQYRIDRMKGQPRYIELWVEKDALSGVLKRITQEYHIRLMVNRGYSSCTAMHDASERFRNIGSRQVHILYLGDHDPSGLDMIRDITDRLLEFGIDANVKRIALTKEQIEEYDPPPNPAKLSDSRSGKYIDEHGDSCWEVDALNPDVLHKIVRKNIEALIDKQLYKVILEQEREGKAKLEEMRDNLDGDEL